jgi:eukaryotic-like serine/threonine-protein kinase
MAIAAGTRFNQYELVSPIGAGGMGEVYLAEDTKLSRKVALKLLPTAFTQDAARVRRFVQEAKAASALNHPNILTIYEVGEANGAHFIATKFIDGETLRAQLHGKKLGFSATLDVATQIASALAAAHAVGIIHRDIKPENVMVRRDAIVKVLDFGLAKLIEQRPEVVNSEAPTIAKVNTDPGTVVGMANYMSPEQARGQEVDARSDIFSLGVVLYEMFAGHAPFEGVNALDVIGAILNREPAPLKSYVPEVPRELEHIVVKALRKDREERYQTVKDLLIDLKDLKRELEIESHLQRAAPRSGPQTDAAANSHVTDGQEPVRVLTAQTTADNQARPSLSAEYLISEIKRHKTGFATLLAVMALALGGGGFGLYRLITRGQPGIAGPPRRVVPFTTFRGSQTFPAFSPDGNQIAFAWDGEKGDNLDIYVKLVDGGEPLRLTNQTGPDTRPVWAPDGRSLAFIRGSSTGRGYYRLAALGGAERLLAEVKGITYGFAWLPDGKALIASERPSPNEPAAIYWITIETGERRKLIATPPGLIDSSPTVSPDGKSLLFYRTNPTGTGEGGGLYTVAISGGEPRQVVAIKGRAIGHAWSTDSSEIIYSAGRYVSNQSGELWRVPAVGGVPEPLTLSNNAASPTIARLGGRLAFVQVDFETHIYRLPVPGQDVPNETPAKFISSTLSEFNPQYSPNGKRIAFVSDRTGSLEIWVCDSEGLNPVQLTSFGNGTTGSPRWAPDSRKIAFDARPEGQADVYVISADGGVPRRLTTEPTEDILPNWSRDGQWLYFCSGRSSNLQVWKMPAEGGLARQITKQGGFESVEEASGKFLSYAKGRNVPGSWEVPVEGGEETPVVEADKAGQWCNWELAEQGIHFTNSDQREKPVIEFFSFVTGKATKLATLDRPIFGTGIGLSPDGRWLLFALIDRQGQSIKLVENFR